MAAEPHTPEPLHPEQLTWAVLLSKWVELARSAAALGPDNQSQALRKLVPDIIMLQAVWHALNELDKLHITEQKLGCLRALWLIDRHEKVIRDTWPQEELPALLEELVDDAKAAYEKACQHVSDHDPDAQGSQTEQAKQAEHDEQGEESGDCPEPDSGPSENGNG